MQLKREIVILQMQKKREKWNRLDCLYNEGKKIIGYGFIIVIYVCLCLY